MKVSFNELKFACKWAALGKGVPPGLADEFACAVLNAAELGFDAVDLAASALQQIDESHAWGKIVFSLTSSELQISRKTNILEAGPLIADALSQGMTLKLDKAVAPPELLVAYIDNASGNHQGSVAGEIHRLPNKKAAQDHPAKSGIETTENKWSVIWQITTKGFASTTDTSAEVGAGENADFS